MPALSVNGQRREVVAEADTPLLWVLRDELRLTGTKYGCGKALCGACTIYVDGTQQRACALPLGSVANKEITTIEGLHGEAAGAVQKAWRELAVPQCGYCQSGQVMAAAALLAANPTPDDAAIRAHMDGNICRCVTYARIVKAIRHASDMLS